MGGTYIKAGKSTLKDPDLLESAMRIAAQLEVRVKPPEARHADEARDTQRDISVTWCVRQALRGVMWELWVYADTYIRSNNTLPLKLQGLAEELQIPVWWLLELPAKWFRVHADGTVELPKYCQENKIRGHDERKGINEVKRQQAASRQSRRRSRLRNGDSHGPVTQGSRRASRRSHAARTPPTGTGTSTGIPKPVEGEEGSPSGAPASSSAALASTTGASRGGINGRGGKSEEPLQERIAKARKWLTSMPETTDDLLARMFRVSVDQAREIRESLKPASPSDPS